MKRFSISLLVGLCWLFANGQESLRWAHFMNKGRSSSPYVLLNLDDKGILGLPESVEVVKRLDKDHVIVRGHTTALNGRAHWSVNNDWKLDVDFETPSDFLLLVVTKNFDASSLQVIKRYHNILVIKSDLSQVKELIENPEVVNVSNNVSIPNVEARVIDMNLNPNRVNKIHHEFPALDGSTELVSIQENRFREDDIDLLSRSIVTGQEGAIFDNHADEMATIIAGAGNSFITGRGVAKRAKITSSDFSPVLPDDDIYYLENGILTQNHSYGIDQDTTYGALAVAFDLSAYTNRNLLHVFSSGNDGDLSAPGGVYEGLAGYSNLTGDIKMTKNSLVVGSVDTVGREVSFVSRGPAYDGRIKPEVVAYSVVGSSNSAALASGVAALLQQEYRRIRNEEMPSALVKALLINSSTDVGSPGLDYVTGYGSIDAYRSLKSLQEERFLTGAVSEGETVSFPLDLPQNALNLKITICWTDPPANAGDVIALVNDLDIRLVNGATTLPWILDETPTVASLSSPATRGTDRLNNVEQVTIAEPSSAYAIEVEGFSVSGLQEFFIAYQYDLENTFEWDFPTGSDNMPYNGETGSYFRWSTTFSGTGTLEYSLDNGSNWELLNASIKLEDGFWRWNHPPLNGDTAIARMVIGSDVFFTDVFTLSAPFKAKVGFNCGDSVMLYWDHVSSAEDYTILSLGSETLEEIATTSDTFLVVNGKSQLTSQRFSIRPNLPGNKSLLPAPTFDYTLQGVDCYIFSLFQTVALDTGIYINLSLGTTYGIVDITFQRNNVFDYVTIGAIEDPGKNEYRFLDTNPVQGYNEHRVIINFENGEQLMLTAGASFYLTDVPVRVFPNPVSGSGVLGIVTRQFTGTPTIELVDSKGSIVLRQDILGTQDFISLPGLLGGIYYYRLFADGEVNTGRVIVR